MFIVTTGYVSGATTLKFQKLFSSPVIWHIFPTLRSPALLHNSSTATCPSVSILEKNSGTLIVKWKPVSGMERQEAKGNNGKRGKYVGGRKRGKAEEGYEPGVHPLKI